MVLFRALGWLCLAMAVAAIVNDCLAWWSEGVFRLLSLGELWARLDFGSLRQSEAAVRHFSSRLWDIVVAPLLGLPALPIFTMAGVILLWVGRRIGSGASPRFVVGSRPPRRRRGRGGIS